MALSSVSVMTDALLLKRWRLLDQIRSGQLPRTWRNCSVLSLLRAWRA